jgi:chromosome segregation ATPase
MDHRRVTVAKKTAHQDALGSFESFRAPWETEGGEDADIDKAKLKRLIYNVKLDYAKSRDAHDETKTDLETVEADLETAKAEKADANGPDAQKQIDKLQKKVDDLTAERDKLVSDKEHADLRAKVLGDLDPKYAKYVQGETEEELEESLKAVKEDFGLSDEPGDDEDPDDDDEKVVRTTPRTRTVVNPADKGGKGGEEVIDFDAVADAAISSGNPFG